jgi:sigma-B regulation protein RsbU (phosphoserine phosphatase)
VINALLLAISTDQLRSSLRADLPIIILGSTIAAIGLAALLVHLSRRRSHERLLLWFGLFAGPYGIRILTNTRTFQFAVEPARFWLFVGRFVEFATIVPALLLFEDFYGKGWRSSVRWVIGGYVTFAVIAFASILRTQRPDLVPTAGIGVVILVPAVLLLGRIMGYKPPQVEDRGVLTLGLVALFVTFAHDRIASAPGSPWHGETEPYGLFILICCLGYVATRRVLRNERTLISLGEEMRAATRIQASILPRAAPELSSIDVAVRYMPMTAVAGDFYDFLTVHPDGLGIIVADVAGHGVPAALVASMIKVAVSSHVSVGAAPARVIAGLNGILCEEAQGQYATAVYLYLDERSRIGRYCAAGHPPPLLWRRSGQSLVVFNEGGLLLGVRPDQQYTNEEFPLTPGDRLLIYTDGLTEAENARGELFGEVRLNEFFKTHQFLAADRFAARLLEEVLAWPGNAQLQADDITILVIDIAEAREQVTPTGRINEK